MFAVAVAICGRELGQRIKLLSLTDEGAAVEVCERYAVPTSREFPVILLHCFEQLDDASKKELYQYLFASLNGHDLLQLANRVFACMKDESLISKGKYGIENKRLPQSLILDSANMYNETYLDDRLIKLLAANNPQISLP